MKIYTIYKATNTVNGKVYIGFDSAWPRRKAQHKNVALYYTGNSKAFYNAIRKHHWDNFIWDVIYQSHDGDHTKNIMEEFFIKEYNSYVYEENSNGYNMTRGGEGTLGHQKTQESIDSTRNKLQGRKQSDEHIKRRTHSRLSNTSNIAPMTNKKHRPESIELMRSASTGVPKSESHKASMRKRPQDTTTLECPHCNKIGDYKNMKRWHMDRCRYNQSRKVDLDKVITCSHCKITLPESPNFYRYHESNCKHK